MSIVDAYYLYGTYMSLQMVISISSQLASQIKPYLTKPEFRQMVLQLLGSEFVAKYLNDLPNQPTILVKMQN